MSKAEQAIISAVINTGSISTVLKYGVTEDWFTSYQDEWVYLLNFFTKNGKVPSKKVWRIKQRSFVIIDIEEVEPFLDTFAEEYGLRLIQEMAGDVVSAIKQKLPVHDIAHLADTQIKNALAKVDAGSSEIDAFGHHEHIFDYVRGRVERAKQFGQTIGIPTGYTSLDMMTGGSVGGQLWIIGGRLGAGKTWQLVKMASSAIKAEKRVSFFALEMPGPGVISRLIPFLTRANGSTKFTADDLYRGHADLDTFGEWLEESKAALAGRFMIDDQSRGKMTTSKIAASVERNKPDIVFVDYLGLLSPKRGDWGAMAQVSADLKAISVQYDVPVICAAQINRDGAGMRELPRVDHIAEADAIGQDANVIVTFAQTSASVLKMGLMKNRDGVGSKEWHVHFDPTHGLMEEVSGDKAKDLKDADDDKADINA